MEEVEHEFLRALGTSVVLPLNTDDPTGGTAPVGKLSWPRVAAECQYLGTAHFEDRLEIELTILKVGNSSVQYGFHFRVGDRPYRQRVANDCLLQDRARPATRFHSHPRRRSKPAGWP